MSCASIHSLVCISFTLFVRSPSNMDTSGGVSALRGQCVPECSTCRHNHVSLLIWNIPDTPLHVYRPLSSHSIGINLLPPLSASNSYEPGIPALSCDIQTRLFTLFTQFTLLYVVLVSGYSVETECLTLSF